MIDNRYDEDLSENLFFQDLKNENPDLLERAIRDKWIICVPRTDSFQRCNLTQEDFLTHLLVPNEELPESHFRTLNGKSVTVKNRVITVENGDVGSSICTHIIFEEIFYTEDLKKYKVWCVENPLNEFQFRKNGNITVVTTLRDCIDLLWTESLGKRILEQLDGVLEEFLLKHKLDKYNLHVLNDLICTLYAKCLQISLSDARLQERSKKNKQLLDNIKISVETYMQHILYKKLFTSISLYTASDDSSFNKIVRNLSDIQLRDLNIEPQFYDIIPCAKHELAKINGYSTGLGKIGCLRQTLSEISRFNQITADSLLPVFIFLVLKTSIGNWTANLLFLKQFQFSSTAADESKFLITTLEAAVEYIRSGNLTGPAEPESQIFERKTETKTVDVDDNIGGLFEMVRLGDWEKVKEILLKNNKTKSLELCHPLCSCDKCEEQNKFRTQPTVYSRDDRGFTALHVACMYGKPNIVELLLENRANIHACDYSGATPLHYAAMRGHQNALLLLLHSGANINAVNSEKSTPLHFACNNGHETCVTAMLYFSELQTTSISINACNALGNTPLHYASRWGYESIVNILLEYGANSSIENRQKQTPLDCAHNLRIYHLIKNTKTEQNKNIKIIPFHLLSNKKFDLKETKPDQNEGTKPENSQEIKKVELLFRAIAYGDIPLVCYYLDLDNNPTTRCHPLCTCENCNSPENEPHETTRNVNICNSEGFTPLHIASLHGRTEIVRLLLQNNARPNMVTRKGLAPLHLACHSQRIEIVKLLLNTEQCNVNLQDSGGNTPLHYACYSKDSRITEMLITAGADVKLKNRNGKSPFDK